MCVLLLGLMILVKGAPQLIPFCGARKVLLFNLQKSEEEFHFQIECETDGFLFDFFVILERQSSLLPAAC